MTVQTTDRHIKQRQPLPPSQTTARNDAYENSDEILTVSELASRLRVQTSWVYGHADLLGAYRLGKYLRFSWGRVLERLEKSSR